MLKSSLKAIFQNPEEILNEVGIRPDLRPEELTIEEFCRLVKKI
jgi:16S rRNA A1518/A1519 N6-dimethyltransferase RsmA/KsgA/DIM1 with predicted DNA glycosylase/AP lyase activity